MMLFQFIVLQIIVFGAVIYFLKKILYSDTQSAVNRLDKTYQDLLTKQKELTQKIEQAEKEYKEKKDEATEITERMKAEAMDKMREKEDQILKSAKAEADEMVKKARSSCDKIRREIEKEVRMNMVDFVGKLLYTALSDRLIQVMHQELVEEFLTKEKELDFSAVSPDCTKLTIRTPILLDVKTKERVLQMVGRKLGRVLEMEETEDKTLVAGMALQFGTLVLDGSFSNMVIDTGAKQKRAIELEA